MKILDKYLVKQFIQTVFFGIIAFTVLFLVIDLMENMDDFIDHDVPFEILLNYYLVFIPEIIKLMTPVSVLFGGLFTAGRLANQNELTAIKAGTISMTRFMVPFFVVSFFISLFAGYFGGFVVPQANKRKAEIETIYLKRGGGAYGSNIFFQDSKYSAVNIVYFDEAKSEAVRFSYQKFDSTDITVITQRIESERMIYDTSSNTWKAFNGRIRYFKDNREEVRYFTETELTGFTFLPKDISIKQQRLEIMTIPELSALIDDQINAGHDPGRVRIEYYSRFSFPATCLIVILFGLPLSANKRKAGLALQFGINILITFIYLGMSEITLAFGKNGALDPLLTAWFVNGVFVLASIVNLLRLRR